MDQVTDTHEPVLIRRRGKEPVALIAASDLSSWMETDYLASLSEECRAAAGSDGPGRRRGGNLHGR